MNYLSAENLHRDLGERVLFSGLSFGLSKGDKMALVANNGTGKSTLLKILAGKDEADRGHVSTREGLRIGYLPQEPDFTDFSTIAQLIKHAQTHVLDAIRAYENAVEQQSEEFSAKNQQEVELAMAEMDRLDAWDYERKAEELLSLFGIREFAQAIESLSGGQKKRLALALTLLDQPEILLLDEPTNHLDIEMIEWLENYLSQTRITLLMVTHDRYFLDRVCNHILELSDGKLYHHRGNYSYFLQKRAEREEVYRVDAEKARQLMRKEQEWIRRMPKARTTKSKSRIEAFYALKEKSLGKKPEQELVLDVKMNRIGGKVLELKKLYKSYGDKSLLKGFDYTFKKGERIGIVGRNGSGKSTLLNVLTGLELADSGKINRGGTLVFGYYSQQGLQLKEDKRVIEVLRDIADVIEMSDGRKVTASQLLNHFLFPPPMQHTFVSKLSGGEKRRLFLLTVLMKNPNFLILDEPTNDLDLITLSKLEDFLLTYGGCLLMVSHDRYFMDMLVDHLFIFQGEGEVQDFNGTYSEYRLQQELEVAEKAEAVLKVAESAARPEKRKARLSYNEQRELEQLDQEIPELEKKKTELEEGLSRAENDHEELTRIGLEIQTIHELIDEKLLRWMELSEKEEN
jgi:ATP-binding cassette subfamily F protein uup